MFLNMLNQKEKELFLELAHNGMLSDGIIQDEEESIFENYRLEMGLDNYELKYIQTSELTSSLMSSTKRVKKVVIIELLGVLLADANISRDEEVFLDELMLKFNFKEREKKKLIEWVEEFNDILAEGYDLITR